MHSFFAFLSDTVEKYMKHEERARDFLNQSINPNLRKSIIIFDDDERRPMTLRVVKVFLTPDLNPNRVCIYNSTKNFKVGLNRACLIFLMKGQCKNVK